MNKDESIALVKEEIFQAIAFFIERQGLVAEAMRDIGLDLEAAGQVGAAAWFSTKSIVLKYGKPPSKLLNEDMPNTEHQDLKDMMKELQKTQRVPQIGVWTDSTGTNWGYFLHGFGCLLQNVQTKEPIDWDFPDVFAFDQYFFKRHLEWRLQSDARNEKLKHTQIWVIENGIDSIISIIKELMDDGLIRKHETKFIKKLALVQ